MNTTFNNLNQSMESSSDAWTLQREGRRNGKSVCVRALEESPYLACRTCYRQATKVAPPADYMHSNQVINPSLPYTRTYIHTNVPSRSHPITYPKFRSKIPINKEKKIHMNMSISETDRLTAHTYRHRPDRQTDRTDIQTSTRQIDKQVV